MNTQHSPDMFLTQELRVNVPLLNREARVVITPPALGVKPKPLENAPVPRGDGIIADLVIEDRR